MKRYITLFVLSFVANSSLLHAGKTFEELDKARLKIRFHRVIEAHKKYLITHKKNQATFSYQTSTILNLIEKKSCYNQNPNTAALESGKDQTEHYLWVKEQMYSLGLLQPKQNKSTNGPIEKTTIANQTVNNEDLDSQLEDWGRAYFSKVQGAFNAAMNNFIEPREAPPQKVTVNAVTSLNVVTPAVAPPPKLDAPQQSKSASKTTFTQEPTAPENAAVSKKPATPVAATEPKAQSTPQQPKSVPKKPTAGKKPTASKQNTSKAQKAARKTTPKKK